MPNQLIKTRVILVPQQVKVNTNYLLLNNGNRILLGNGNLLTK
jgi:hypothetical protein